MAFITLVSPSKASWTSSLVHLLKAKFHKAYTTLLKKHIGQRSSGTFSDSWVKQTIYNRLLWITGLANVTQIWPENNWKESNVSHRLQIPVSTLHWFCRLSRAKSTESSHGDNTLRGLWSHKLNSSLCSVSFWFNNADDTAHCSRSWEELEETPCKLTSTCKCPWVHYTSNHPEKNFSRYPWAMWWKVNCHNCLTKFQYTQQRDISSIKCALLCSF